MVTTQLKEFMKFCFLKVSSINLQLTLANAKTKQLVRNDLMCSYGFDCVRFSDDMMALNVERYGYRWFYNWSSKEDGYELVNNPPPIA